MQKASGCCRFGQETFAGTHGNGRDAPKPVILGPTVIVTIDNLWWPVAITV
jgi:hypothetical protein